MLTCLSALRGCLQIIGGRIRLLAVVLTVVVAGSAVAEASTVLHLKQAQLYDSQGFGRPIVARTFLLPSDWQVAGGVQWNTALNPNQSAYYESFIAASPDREATFQLLPAYNWLWYSDPYWRSALQQSGMQLAPPLDAAGVITEYIIPNYRPGAVVTKVVPRPELAQAFRQQLEALGLRQLETNGCRITLDFVEAELRSVEHGQTYRETAVVQLFRADFPDTGMQSFTASNLFLFRAPADRWQQYATVYATAMKSMRQNPAWLRAIHRYQRNIAAINMAGAVKRHQIMMNAYEEMADDQQQAWEQRQDSIDRIAREFGETIREVETYRDPGTGLDVELPAGSQYVFANGLGEYILTDDPTWNPNHFAGNGDWQAMEPVR